MNILKIFPNGKVPLTICVAVALNIIPIAGFAQTQNDKLNEFLTKIEEADKKINTLKADFTQTIFFESTKEKQEITGTVFLKKPNDICIKQTTPQEQQIYIDGKNIIIYAKANKQAIIDNWKNVIDSDFSPATIMNFGRNLKKLKKTNSINFSKENEKYIVLKINPIKNENWYMQVYISKETMYPTKVIVKSDDVLTKIVLKIHSINPALDKNIFKFTASENIEVIKLN